jgi:hypothetical protein
MNTTTRNKPAILIGPASPLRSYSAPELSRVTGCSIDHAYKSLRGVPVGSQFIAACMLAFPNLTFPELFLIQANGVIFTPPAKVQAPAPVAPAPEMPFSVPLSWDAAGGDAESEPGVTDPITEMSGPRRVPVRDQSGQAALWFEPDDTIQLTQNWQTNPVVLRVLDGLGIKPEEIRTRTVPSYMVRGERHAQEEEG